MIRIRLRDAVGKWNGEMEARERCGEWVAAPEAGRASRSVDATVFESKSHKIPTFTPAALSANLPAAMPSDTCCNGATELWRLLMPNSTMLSDDHLAMTAGSDAADSGGGLELVAAATERIKACKAASALDEEEERRGCRGAAVRVP